ncbi:hypothetical protein SAMN05444050_1622 [Afipia sp. GAS231]|nr:hypothetical protein SAMN05444050_1622 [Afipia sp. GAS231]
MVLPAALRNVPFNAVALVAPEHLDQRLGPNSGQFAQWLHVGVAVLALAGVPGLFGHPERMDLKPVGTMKIGPVRLLPLRRLGEIEKPPL